MLLRFFILILTFSISTAYCPRKESLHPCTCESSEHDTFIKCLNIENDLVLSNAVSSLRGVKDIFSFTLENAVLNYIPHNLFEGVELMELEFTSSSIMAFSDTDVAFKGLEDHLLILLFNDCSFMNSWDWSLLRNMKKLLRLDIVGGDLVSIESDVREINHLSMQDISFSRNTISYVYEFAFSNFTELLSLTLSHNVIEEVKRSMLPNPAPKLRLIDLGYNEIQRLPEDFFENMPKLEEISIPMNKILTLDEKTYAPVWGQLEGFLALNNKLRCDCRMLWIFDKKMPKNVRATCDQPSRLKGKNLMELSSKDLWC